MTTTPPAPSKSFLKILIPVVGILLIVAGSLSLIKSRLAGPAGAPNGAEGAPGGGAQVGSTLPDFTLTGLQGKSSKFSDIRAKVVLVNFWATWCEACMVEMPSIVQLRNSYKDKGFEVVGINLDENPEAVVPRAEKELGITFPIFSDPENKITDFFDVHAIPLSVILGPGRKILYIENGEKNWNDQEIHQRLEQWLSDEKA